MKLWNDGSNTLAIAPGEVVVYSRNYVTNEILEKEKGKNILIVTHTITLKSYLCELEKRDIDTLWDPPFIKQTSLTEINFTEDGYEMPLVACMKHHEYAKKEFNEFKSK